MEIRCVLKTTILIHCQDQAGIIFAVTEFLYSKGGNIIYLDQHVDHEANVFFMRVECHFTNSEPQIEVLKYEFQRTIADARHMKWQWFTDHEKPRMALFVSKYHHCLYDILSRYQSGELRVEIPFIISNHETLEPIAQQFNIPFYHIPVTKTNKAKAEAAQLRLLKEHQIDFLVLARYMQIISNTLISQYENKIINIHHSFLPAFAGAKPYHAAFERGVKIIGATSHYVTEELDAGPIIVQDVTPVLHSHAIKDFITKGRDLEKIVLSRGLQLHVQHKVMVYNNKTVIFS